MYNNLIKFEGIVKHIINILDDDMIFEPHKYSKNKLIIRVPYNKRLYYIGKLCEHRQCTFDSSTADSSLGRVDYNGYKIIVKPLKYAVNGPGIQNETLIYNLINDFIKVHKTLDVIFYTDNKKNKYSNITRVTHTSHNTRGYKKSDIQLFSHSSTRGNISIKQDNSDKWESLNNRYRDLKEKFIEKCLNGNLNIVLKQRGRYSNKYFMYDPNTDRRITQVSINNLPDMDMGGIIFGTDIPKTTVIRRTFSKSDFAFYNKTLFIRVSDIYNTLDDITAPIVPVFKHHFSKMYGIELSARNNTVIHENTRTYDYDEINK